MTHTHTQKYTALYISLMLSTYLYWMMLLESSKNGSRQVWLYDDLEGDRTCPTCTCLVCISQLWK